MRGEFHSATSTYRELYRKVSREKRAIRGVIAYEMAENHRRLNQPTQAIAAYRNAIRYEYPDTLMFFHLAQMLHREGNYEAATVAYRDFLALRPDHPMGIAGLEAVELAVKWRDAPTRFKVQREPIFNSNRADFSPMLSPRGDRLYFTSSREDAQGEERSPVTGMKYNDLFYAETNVHGEWKQPKRIETTLNTDFDEGTPSFSPDGEWMFYTFSSPDANRPSGTAIYVSRRVNGEWSGGRLLLGCPSSSPPVSFAHPSASTCGKYLYFVSDMPGGMGGKDIWRATLKREEGQIGVTAIENMGPDINSRGNEMFPYAKYETILYFSSDGHPGMGGLDLFVAVMASGAERWNVQNMQSPINSPADDFGITFYPGEMKGFFSSNRDDTRGYDHIYSFEYMNPVIRIEGMVVDHQDEFIPEATVRVVGSNGFSRRFIANNEGEYSFEADAGVEYLFTVNAKGFLEQKRVLTTLPVTQDTLLYVDFEMIPFNKPVVIENIFYDFDSAVLRPESEAGLEEMVHLMNEYPEVFVELSAHTDRMGSDDYNNDLSWRRAVSVIDYLVARGIDKERLSAAGHGKSHPMVVNKKLADSYDFLEEGDVLTDEFIEQLDPTKREVADQINRRTSFVVTGYDL